VVGDRDDVDGLVLVVEREHRLVDGAVAIAVEVRGLEALLDDQRVERAVGDEDRAEDRHLGVEVVRRRRQPGQVGRRRDGGLGRGGHVERATLATGPEGQQEFLPQ
jgi:hypothetical protein